MGAIYATSTIASELGISKASLQNYITILEEHGYEVRRNSRMHRQFTDADVELLRRFLTLHKQQGFRLKDAARAILDPKFNPDEINTYTIVTAQPQVSQFEDISNSMQLLATHVHGIEQQNMQLLTLIEEQRTQNELLIEQNFTLKQQLSSMMQHFIDQANEPNEMQKRQLDRLEQQNSAIMSVLNKLNASQPNTPTQAPAPVEEISNTQAKGLLKKLFK